MAFLFGIMKTNNKPATVRTHEGGVASRTNAIEELRRTVLACLLWENGFYESGEAVGDRIRALVPQCAAQEVADLAIEARNKQRLRHVPLLLVRELARDSDRCPSRLIANTLCSVIQRADELAEFLALYWKDGKIPLAKQVKKGLACAFEKFDEYQLAKYNRDATVKLRDVLFMVHAKPKDAEQAAIWKRLVEGQLSPPDTWEVALSGGADKKETFERLLQEGKLGYMALLRNLRNMRDAGVEQSLVFDALIGGATKSKALPFRYVAAARAVPQWEPQLDQAMQVAMQGMESLGGRTCVLVDVSGSMNHQLSAKSDLRRIDAAGALAVLVRGIAEDCRVFRFNDQLSEVPPRQGMALIDAIGGASGGTYLGAAVEALKANVSMDRLIVITDEQTADRVGSPGCKGYLINVATNKNGVGYGQWTHIHGFSEAIVNYIVELERLIAIA